MLELKLAIAASTYCVQYISVFTFVLYYVALSPLVCVCVGGGEFADRNSKTIRHIGMRLSW